MSSFEDYIRDIPMDVSVHFFPKPEIRIPVVNLPPLPDLDKRLHYGFESEHRARSVYQRLVDEKETEKVAKTRVETPTSKPSTPGPSAAPVLNEVLLPSRVSPSTPSTSAISTPQPKPLISYEEFEGKGSVFDDLELKSIDDKKALSQVLSSSSVFSEPTSGTRTAEPLKASGLPSYPSLSFGPEPNSFTQATEPTISVMKTAVAYQSAPSVSQGPPPPPASKPKVTNGVNHNDTVNGSSSFYVSLRSRLVGKGYRQNLIDAAIADVPRERVVHIEYYMKGMSILEKRDVPVKKSLAYLLDSGVTDKQEIINRATTAEQLLTMGFPADKVLPAVNASSGDRVKALESILAQ